MTAIDIRTIDYRSERDRDAVFQIFKESPNFLKLTENREASNFDVQDFFEGIPKGKDSSDKFTLGVFFQSRMIGCLDLIRSFPAADCAFIGLLLISERYQRSGHGRTALQHVRQSAISWGCRRIRLGVISTNTPAVSFWVAAGFNEVGRAKNDRYMGDIHIFEQILAQGPNQ